MRTFDEAVEFILASRENLESDDWEKKHCRCLDIIRNETLVDRLGRAAYSCPSRTRLEIALLFRLTLELGIAIGVAMEGSGDRESFTPLVLERLAALEDQRPEGSK